ncbi:uncharacterized protein LOC103190123 isoform X2 [Callorhinchus milii]|uniref:uncharacterized protein LOC103190123 isoform X2 n=1 Tax=Callorhinchus milii TaxID=7868 RepID=UPI0004574953|nr:uncharacterized protein LOC103190123 isoform X2 [Callorhinchus milii]|eukprot:gi/632984123/ref/XP_007908984.1/ PREDICTED: uncharacterized protein LOC103190123 isoform X2 [Callorhinchus milii]
MLVTSLQAVSSVCPGNSNGERMTTARRPSTVFGWSRTEKVDRRVERRNKISPGDLRREEIADKLKCPLVFLAPVILILALLLVLFAVYSVKPFHKALNFISGNCKVTGSRLEPQGSCNSGGNIFSPCVQIKIALRLSDSSRQLTLLMENEQALSNCQQCSFTFGHHGVFADRLVDCQGWQKNYNKSACATKYLLQFGQLTLGVAVNSLLWPFLILLGYGSAGGFVLFDYSKRRKLNNLLESQQTKETQKEKNSIKRHKRNKPACRHGNHFTSYLYMSNGSLSCTCLDHVCEEPQTTLTPSAEAAPSRPSIVRWTEQDLLDLEHLDLAITDYNQSRPSSVYSNVFTLQDGEVIVDNETEWYGLHGDIIFGISEQDIDNYFASISRRHNFRQSILPFHPFGGMDETRV